MGACFVFSSLVGCDDATSIEDVRSLHASGKYAGALEPLRELLAAAPDDPELNYLYGAALRRTGAPDQAIWSLRKAAASENWAREAGLELGSAAIAAQDWTTAISIADDLLLRYPDEPRALAIRADARLSDKSNFEAALADFDRALALDPEDLDLHASRAANLIALGRLDEAAEAIGELEKKAAAGGTSPQARGRLCIAQALFAAERELHEEASAHFERCLASFPEHASVLDEYVSYLDERGRPERSNEVLRQRVEARPDQTTVRIVLARRLTGMKRLAEAEALLRAGLEIGRPGISRDVWAAMADVQVALGDLVAAAEAYEKSLEFVDEPTVFQRLALADTWARAGRNARALEIARTLENDAYRSLIEARVHLNEHRPALALARLDEALPTWPNNAGARYWAARAAEQIGDFDRAIEEYRQSIRSAAGFSDAGLRLGLIHEAEGAGDDAWASVNPLLEEKPDEPEAVALMTRLASRFGPESRLHAIAQNFRERVSWPVAVAARADFLAETLGAEEAVASIRGSQGISLTRESHAPALRSLVRHLVALGRFGEASKLVDAALTAAPRSPALYEIRGLLLEAQNDASGARLAYEQAIEIDAKNARALVGLGRIRADAGELEAGLELFRRAEQADPRLADAYTEAARRLASANRKSQAEERLEALLRERPHLAADAATLARLRLERGVHDDRSLELARRAIRFRGGPQAYQLLAQVHAARGEAELAKKALERAARVEAAN